MSSAAQSPAWQHELTNRLLEMALAAPAGSGTRLFLIKAIGEFCPWEDLSHAQEFKHCARHGLTQNVSYWQTYEAVDPTPLREIYDSFKLQLVDVSPHGVSRLQQAIRHAEEAWDVTRSVSQLQTAQAQEPGRPAPSPDESEVPV